MPNAKCQMPNAKCQMPNRGGASSGFTLIELSIVIVIIGLIVSSVVGGQALVKQAKVRSQISDLQKYHLAYNAFKLEYGSPPGDLSRASSYWSGSPNGNGNKRIDAAADAAYIDGEAKMFWKHLSDSGLIEGSYAGSGTLTIGITHPAMKLDERFGMTAGGALTNNTVQNAEAGPVYQLSYANGQRKYRAALWLNDSRSSSGVTNNFFDDTNGTADPQTFRDIDKKVDDGIALSGIFRTYRARQASPDCLTAQDGIIF